MLIADNKKIKTYYQALLNRESSFVGIFYVGVKATSIFCIATCRARKPKLENVEFYTTLIEALERGTGLVKCVNQRIIAMKHPSK